MKKPPLFLSELLIWLRGRFSLTGEEKVWLLIVLVILWAGLLGRYFHLKNQKPELLSPRQVQEMLTPDEP